MLRFHITEPTFGRFALKLGLVLMLSEDVIKLTLFPKIMALVMC